MFQLLLDTLRDKQQLQFADCFDETNNTTTYTETVERAEQFCTGEALPQTVIALCPPVCVTTHPTPVSTSCVAVSDTWDSVRRRSWYVP